MASSLDEESTKAEMPALLTLDAKSSRTRTSKTLLAILTLLSLAAAALYFYRNVEPFEPLKRYSLHYGKVACWQDGGVWIKELTPVEMSSLAIDRFQDIMSGGHWAGDDAAWHSCSCVERAIAVGGKTYPVKTSARVSWGQWRLAVNQAWVCDER
ncbi:hypothetical protein NUW58_g7651 [Xylaria curta]|uniref:Uncharacterized protein n=1 Tax=Xylaria curta TaxID=42375 RepID=A0ACC1NHQ9_9PEZI|nr:hypothetical protein NUW58_g7651 [Xylaria curta]